MLAPWPGLVVSNREEDAYGTRSRDKEPKKKSLLFAVYGFPLSFSSTLCGSEPLLRQANLLPSRRQGIAQLT